jgi:hypothetical protein
MDNEMPTPEELAFVVAVMDGLVAEWARFGRPLPRTVARARGILGSALTCAMSLERQGIESDSEESSSEKIGSDEVAELLGVTRRTVQRNAEILGGQRVSRSWVFDKNDIGANPDGRLEQ